MNEGRTIKPEVEVPELFGITLQRNFHSWGKKQLTILTNEKMYTLNSPFHVL